MEQYLVQEPKKQSMNLSDSALEVPVGTSSQSAMMVKLHTYIPANWPEKYKNIICNTFDRLSNDSKYANIVDALEENRIPILINFPEINESNVFRNKGRFIIQLPKGVSENSGIEKLIQNFESVANKEVPTPLNKKIYEIVGSEKKDPKSIKISWKEHKNSHENFSPSQWVDVRPTGSKRKHKILRKTFPNAYRSVSSSKSPWYRNPESLDGADTHRFSENGDGSFLMDGRNISSPNLR